MNEEQPKEDVVFDEAQKLPERAVAEKKLPFFTNLVIRIGLAKDEKHAQIVLLVFVVAFAALTLYLLPGAFDKGAGDVYLDPNVYNLP